MSNVEQVQILIEKSKDTPIYMPLLFNVLMGLRRSEINGLKYSDVDYVNRTLKVERQLGKVLGSNREEYAPKTFTKQELPLKTLSSYRELPIPDLVFEAILEEQKNMSRTKEDELMTRIIRSLMGIIFAVQRTGSQEVKDFIINTIRNF